MQPIHFPGATEVKKPDQMTDEQCFSIFAQPIDYVFEGVGGQQYQSRVWLEAWKPSKEDLDAINRGEPIWIQIHCMQLVPIAVFTTDENGNSNDAG